MEIYEKIIYLREKNNITQKKLANLMDIDKAVMSRIERGERDLRAHEIKKIAELFNISADYLLSTKINNHRTISILEIENLYTQLKNILVSTKKIISNSTTVTSLADKRKEKQQEISSDFLFKGAASAGTGKFLEDEIHETVSFPHNMIPSDADYCLLINGNSMEPVVLDGSYIFVKDTHEVASGSIAAVIYNGESYIKRVWFENDTARLESFNKDYEDIIVKDTDTFQVTGKVLF